jgi:SARP family transcriptional regulator, regulator of embCAB operon
VGADEFVLLRDLRNNLKSRGSITLTITAGSARTVFDADESAPPLPLPELEVRVLGPLTATVNGRSFVPTATKPRTVLALLLLNADHVVSTSALQRELWASNPPRSALTTVQTYILQIRKLLAAALGGDEAAARQVLVTTTWGYMLRMNGAERDLDVYHRYVAAGTEALHQGESARASALLTAALRLWTADALVDVAAGSLLNAEMVRLQSSRTTVLEQRIEADLDQGAHQRVLGELAALTAEDAFNENLRALYILALHRCGRRRDALAEYQRTREMLIGELGLEPGIQLRRAHQAILADCPEPH